MTPLHTATAAMPDSLHWFRNSAEYRATAIQAYHLATQQIEKAAAGMESGTWAVILDADETVISNLEYQIELAEKHQTHTAEAWRAWVARRAATPLPGAAAFLARTRELGGPRRCAGDADPRPEVLTRLVTLWDPVWARMAPTVVRTAPLPQGRSR